MEPMNGAGQGGKTEEGRQRREGAGEGMRAGGGRRAMGGRSMGGGGHRCSSFFPNWDRFPSKYI